MTGMTPDQIAELLDLYLDDELPEAMRAFVETYLTAQPAAGADVRSLRQTVVRLKAAPAERPDTWFVERTLDRLLHEDAAARPNEIHSSRS